MLHLIRENKIYFRKFAILSHGKSEKLGKSVNHLIKIVLTRGRPENCKFYVTVDIAPYLEKIRFILFAILSHRTSEKMGNICGKLNHLIK